MSSLEFSNIESTRPNAPFGLKSKFGSTSFFATHNNKKVKVYETLNEKQMKLRLFIDSHPICKFFPKVIGTENSLVIEEFIYGISATDYSSVNTIHRNLLDINYPESTWDYLKYIYERVGLKKPKFNLTTKINHNDITRANLINTSDGIKIIDNEFLACNDGWIMNYLNSDILKNELKGEHIKLSKQIWRIRKSWKR